MYRSFPTLLVSISLSLVCVFGTACGNVGGSNGNGGNGGGAVSDGGGTGGGGGGGASDGGTQGGVTDGGGGQVSDGGTGGSVDGGNGAGDAGTSGDAGSGTASDGGSPDAGPLPVPDPVVQVPNPVPAPVDNNPTSPATDDGSALSWPTAPEMTGVQVAVGRDSAVVVVPAVTGARDYRVFPVPAGTSLNTDASGAEAVDGTRIFCAGLRQHNDVAVGAGELMRAIEVSGLTGPTRLVVEAVDAPCPFPGVMGREHHLVPVHNSALSASEAVDFSVYTADEIQQTYGSVIYNGQGPAATLGQPAPPVAPHVLARTTVVVTPEGTGTSPGLDYFDDFAANDEPQLVGQVDSGGRSAVPGLLWQNQKWSFYSYAYAYSDVFIEHGQLHTLLADWAQDVFGSNVIYPRRTVTVPSNGYLRVVYDVDSDATSRRYWWISLCGADQQGQTMDAQGQLLSPIVQTPFFYQPDGHNPSLAHWNCLQVFPRDGTPFGLAPSGKRPQSDIRVMLNVPGAPARSSVVNLSPDQFHNATLARPSWFRMQDGQGNLLGPILDDQMLISPRTHFELYVRRDRVILYVNGQQRLCDDFPSIPLTMAEGALGFGQVLYHSAAERHEFFQSFNDRTGQRYLIHDTPYIDARTWDNLGFQEDVGAPAGFDPSQCYTYAP